MSVVAYGKGFVVKSPVTVVGAIVFIIFLTVILILGIASIGQGVSEGTLNALVVALLGIVGTTIPSILALYKAEGAQQTAKKVGENMTNGVMKETVREAIKETPEIKEHVKSAIEETGVVTREGPVIQQSMEATHLAMQTLAELLRDKKGQSDG